MPAKTEKQAREFERTDADEVCAGIVVQSTRGRYLLLYSDAGEWTEPGGHAKPGETLDAAAQRETFEETGVRFEHAQPFRVSRSGGVAFTALFAHGVDEFTPRKDRGSRDEWTKFGWFAPDALPDGVNPEVARSIAILEGNELDRARAMIADGVLSPQQVANAWLFDLRITGTGAAYRRGLDEFVWRAPENFLTDEFVARCNGLPVIMEHPKDGVLDGTELHDRIAGTVVLPYLAGSEVRGIARVIDADAARAMLTTFGSTSPAVAFRESSGTEAQELDGGSSLLIEGVPSYLDHLAICTEGVWDKNGPATGINRNAITALRARA